MVWLSGGEANLWVQFFSYYLTAAAFGVFLLFVFKHPAVWRFFRSAGKGHRLGIGVVLVSSAFLHVHSPHTYFVEFDESGLTATSLLMHEKRQAAMPTKAYYLNGQMNYYDPYVGKRPVLFPFLISLVHDLTGYRPANSFVINALAGLLLLGGIYALLARWYGRRYGILGVLLLMTLPLVAQNATGGGFDLLNVALLVLILNLGNNFVRQSNTLNYNFFVFGLILLAQARYESILFLIAGAVVILLVWRREGKIWIPGSVVAAPLLLISPMLSIRVFTSFEEHKQLQDGVEHFFHVSNVSENLELAIFYFFQISNTATNSFFLSVVGAIALLFCLLLLIKKGLQCIRRPNPLSVFFPFLFFVVFNTGWALTNFWGQFTDPVVARITLPIYVFAAIGCAIAAKEFFGMRPLPAWILWAVGLWAFIFSQPSVSRSYLKYDHLGSRTPAVAVKFAHEVGTPEDLFIGPSTLPFIVNERATLAGGLAQLKPAHLIRSQEIGFFDEIYVVLEMKRVAPGEFRARRHDRLLDIYEMELVHEERFRVNIFTRIYRITGLKPGIPAWDELENLRNLPLPDGDPEDHLEGYYLRQLP